MKFVRRFYKNLCSKYQTFRIHFARNPSSHLPKLQSLKTYANQSIGCICFPKDFTVAAITPFQLLATAFFALQLCYLPWGVFFCGVSPIGLNGRDGGFCSISCGGSSKNIVKNVAIITSSGPQLGLEQLTIYFHSYTLQLHLCNMI